jgi:hypothetical protein
MQGLAARSDGAEGEKSAGMVGAAPLAFGSKGAAEQARSRETALLARWTVLMATRAGRGNDPSFRSLLALKKAGLALLASEEKGPL